LVSISLGECVDWVIPDSDKSIRSPPYKGEKLCLSLLKIKQLKTFFPNWVKLKNLLIGLKNFGIYRQHGKNLLYS
ncbi:hypothetical protein, partial [Parasutterella excrementihominis]|uniref:hypothetical protein n=2 Tax=Parasutterella excrementihominis TaxID=487175 RepID=UPI003AF75003